MGPWYDTANDPQLTRQHETGLITDLDRHARAPRAPDSDSAVLSVLVALVLVIGVGIFAADTPVDEAAIGQAYSSRP